jgi:hypothetical protein
MWGICNVPRLTATCLGSGAGRCTQMHQYTAWEAETNNQRAVNSVVNHFRRELPVICCVRNNGDEASAKREHIRNRDRWLPRTDAPSDVW